MPSWIPIVEWASRLILLLLVALSIWSVSIMIERRRYFRSLRDGKASLAELKKAIQDRGVQGALASSALASGSPLAVTLQAAGAAFASRESASADSETIERTIRSALAEERARLEKGLTVLATLGSNAPFIGLFGTVLGIIQAFGELAKQSSGTQGVMAGISEALIATAIGLFVAIPAVVSYNYFSKQVRDVLLECESLKDFCISRRGSGGRTA